MAKAVIINKNIQLSLFDIIKFQINTHCFMNRIKLSPAQMDCLTLLGLYGEINMSDFCIEVVKEEVFGNVQTTRNFVTKCIQKGLVKRGGVGNKLISLADPLEVLTEGNIVLNLKIYHIETNKS